LFLLGKIEGIVAKALKYPPEQRAALSAKIKYYRKLGFPKLPTPGTGNRSEFDSTAVLQLVAVFRLEKLGLPPKHAMQGATVLVDALNSELPQNPYLVFDGRRFAVISSVAVHKMIDQRRSGLLVSVRELLAFAGGAIQAVTEPAIGEDKLISMALHVYEARDGNE
jgi:hypothetical protein